MVTLRALASRTDQLHRARTARRVVGDGQGSVLRSADGRGVCDQYRAREPPGSNASATVLNRIVAGHGDIGDGERGAAPPMSNTVTVCAALVVPTGCSRKASKAGLSVAAALAGAISRTKPSETVELEQDEFGANISATPNATLSSLVYSTHLGQNTITGRAGSQTPSGTANYGIAVDSSGNAYVVGLSGGCAFITKLNAGGSSILYNSSLWCANPPGTHAPPGVFVSAVAVDASQNAYAAGGASILNTSLPNSVAPCRPP
jgi:hypothetical protein